MTAARTFLALSILLSPSAVYSAQALPFVDLMDSYAWGSGGAVAGVLHLNVFDDVTGEFLLADNGDRPDVTVFLSTTIAPLGTGGFDYNAGTGVLRASQGFGGTVGTNHPGTRVVNSMRILFADHLEITNLNANFTSLNSAGNAWETSRLAILDPEGSFFSTPPALEPYPTHTPVIGGPSQYTGFFFSDSTATVEGVGTNQTSSGTALGSLENLTATNGNSFLDYADVGLAPGTRIGGFEWITVLEDTRGSANAASNFTSSMTEFSIGGITLIPEPSSALLVVAGLAVGCLRRRR